MSSLLRVLTRSVTLTFLQPRLVNQGELLASTNNCLQSFYLYQKYPVKNISQKCTKSYNNIIT
eukprot:Pgem_evm1s14920